MHDLISTPAFGEADLSNCEREQIHLAGSIQPHGALLLLREPDLVVVQESASAGRFLGIAGSLLGRTLDDLHGDLARNLPPLLDEALHTRVGGFRCTAGSPPRDLDCLIHRPPGGGLVIEMEPSAPPIDPAGDVEAAFRAILGAASLRALADESAAAFKAIAGYDRVMVYRFDEDGHGEVFAEAREPALEPFLGNRYPASDIPQIARRLYERNRVRVLVDVHYTPVPLVPRLSPLSGRDLDMSLCGLRSMSPIHCQYLMNMGVAATLVASLMVGGKLWGLIACHHYETRHAGVEIRAVAELLAETIATRIAALESFAQSQAEMSVRRLEQRMVEAISREGDWRAALFDNSQALLQPLGAGGAALIADGQILTTGEVPGSAELREIAAWLDRRTDERLIATASLSLDEPGFAGLTAVASGVLAVPVSNLGGEYLIWFRPERIRTVVWGGNPFKPMVIGDDPADLSPRRSFAQWHQLMEGHAEKWSAADLTAARLIGDTVADVILQSRSVRLLIAQDQLDHVRRQVGRSDQPVVIASSDGAILLANDAFERLIHTPHLPLIMLEDLAGFFHPPQEIRQHLRALPAKRQPWRLELRLRGDRGNEQPLLLRVDPVMTAPDRILGFVLVFIDLTEQKAALSARRRFQEGIVEGHRAASGRLGGQTDLVYHRLLSSVEENAQLAALEIADRQDMARMPLLLESLRASLTRAAEVLEHLASFARRKPRA